MKEYVKPTIDVTALASSTPIAAKSCTGDNIEDWDQVDYYEDNNTGEACYNYVWDNGSN